MENWEKFEYPKKLMALNELLEGYSYSSYGINLFLDTLSSLFTGNLKSIKQITENFNEKKKLLLEDTIETFIKEALKHPFDDILGDFILYAKSQKDKQYKGQFFTPMPVCLFMAESLISLKDIESIKRKIKIGELFSIAEPSSGSGRMLLAVAKTLKKYIPDIPFEKYLYTMAIDIDPLCVRMTIINTSLWNIPCKVVQGDALQPIKEETHKIYLNIPLINQIEQRKNLNKAKVELIKMKTR